MSFTNQEHPDRTEWVIEGLVPAGQVGVLSGAAGVGKTTVALDMALSVATGTPFRGRPVTRGAVLFLVDSERSVRHVSGRVKAWLAEHPEADASSLNYNFFCYVGPSLVSDKGRSEMADCTDDKSMGTRLIVIDDWERAMVGGDTDSCRDVGMAVLACEQATAAGATVLVVSGEGPVGLVRWSSDLMGAAAFGMALAESDEHTGVPMRMYCTKMRDAEPFSTVSLPAYVPPRMWLGRVDFTAEADAAVGRLDAAAATLGANKPDPRQDIRWLCLRAEGAEGALSDLTVEYEKAGAEVWELRAERADLQAANGRLAEDNELLLTRCQTAERLLAAAAQRADGRDFELQAAQDELAAADQRAAELLGQRDRRWAGATESPMSLTDKIRIACAAVVGAFTGPRAVAPDERESRKHDAGCDGNHFDDYSCREVAESDRLRAALARSEESRDGLLADLCRVREHRDQLRSHRDHLVRLWNEERAVGATELGPLADDRADAAEAREADLRDRCQTAERLLAAADQRLITGELQDLLDLLAAETERADSAEARYASSSLREQRLREQLARSEQSRDPLAQADLGMAADADVLGLAVGVGCDLIEELDEARAACTYLMDECERTFERHEHLADRYSDCYGSLVAEVDRANSLGDQLTAETAQHERQRAEEWDRYIRTHKKAKYLGEQLAAANASVDHYAAESSQLRESNVTVADWNAVCIRNNELLLHAEAADLAGNKITQVAWDTLTEENMQLGAGNHALRADNSAMDAGWNKLTAKAKRLRKQRDDARLVAQVSAEAVTALEAQVSELLPWAVSGAEWVTGAEAKGRGYELRRRIEAGEFGPIDDDCRWHSHTTIGDAPPRCNLVAD